MRVVAALTLTLALIAPPVFAGAPATVTVVVRQPPQRTVLKLVPDYALVLAFDRPIGAVGIGDDTLVATAVRETDLIMKALRPSGRTNLLVWAGDVRTVWEIVVNRTERTADIVQVITQQPTSPSPPPAAPPQESSAPPAGTSPSQPVPEAIHVSTTTAASSAYLTSQEGTGRVLQRYLREAGKCEAPVAPDTDGACGRAFPPVHRRDSMPGSSSDGLRCTGISVYFGSLRA